jgi:site-specific recombinase XerC
MQKKRKTLADIQYYPRPQELYDQLIASKGWKYQTRKDFYLTRDRSLVSLLYLGDFRISEVLPLTKQNFQTEENYVLVKAVKVGKRKEGRVLYREARLPLEGIRKVWTELIIAYLEMLKAEERLFPWSLEKKTFTIGEYKLKDGTIKKRISTRFVGTARAWQIVHALLPHLTQHWLRAFGYSFDYDHMDHDILAVSDKTKADPRSIQPYLRRRYEKYPVT